MSKEIKFNVKLLVDGKEQLTTATASVRELRANLEAARDRGERLRNTLIQYNQTVETIRGVNGALSQLVGVLNGVTEESRSFSAAMTSANTMAGKGGADFAKLKGEVAELAKTLPVARDELANGLYQVISNGVPEDNWITYLQQSAKASVGGIADLGETVKVTSTVIKNYGLEWNSAGEIQDKIQLTAKNGVTSFEQLAQALPRVTSNAATLGVSIDELLATFATLTGVSGNTAEVSTQLAAIFTALVKPSSEATKMAQQMGIEFDAAAIKVAGGMSNFITQLDKDVKRYAASSGMLEMEVYGKLFGSAESLRALVPLTGKLADKFEENVAAMEGSAGTIEKAFDMMAGRGSARLQMLKNGFGEVTDAMSSFLGQSLPVLNFMSQMGSTIVSVLALNAAWKTFGGAVLASASRLGVANAAIGLWRAASVRANAITQLFSATLRGAAVSAGTLKLAMQGLMISTGVGVAIWALSEAVAYFASSSDEATEKADNLKEAEDVATSASAQVKVEIDAEVKKLGELIQAKQDTTEAVKNLNAKYGDIFGSHKKASEWYDILTKKSKIYIKQIGYEAQAKVLASKLAEKEIELENNYSKRRDLWKSGGAGHSAPVVNVVDKDSGEIIGQSGGNFVESGAYKSLKDEARGLIPEIEELKRKLGVVEDKMKEVSVEMQNIGKTTTSTLKVSEMNWSQTEKAIEDTVSKMKNTTDKATISKLQAYKKQLEARQKVLKGMGVSTETGDLTKTKKTTKEPKFYKNPTTEHELQKNISYYEGKLNGQDTEEQRKLTANIKLWKEKYNAIQLAKKAALVPAELKTADDVNAKLDYLNAKKSVATQAELPEITREISKTELKGLELQRSQSISANSSDEEIDREIAYQQKLKSTSEGATDAIDKEIKRLERLKDKRTELQIMQDALSDVQEEFDNATTVEAKVKASAKISEIQKQIDEATKGKLTIEAETEPAYIVQGSTADKRESYSNAQARASRIQQDYEIGLTGKAEAERRMAELNKELESLGAGLKPLKLELDASGFDKAMDSLRKGWGDIEGIGSGIDGITSALEGDKSAWERVTGVVDGFFGLMESLTGIIKMVGLFNAATTATSTATGASAAAAAADVAGKAAEEAAAIPLTLANKSLAASFLELAAASYFAAHAYIPFAGFGIASGFAAEAAAVTKTMGALAFATGGIVPGTSWTGDKVVARVNSGEMILNAAQQARLFALAEGRYNPPAFAERQPTRVAMGDQTPRIDPVQTQVSVHLNANARRMLDMTYEAKRVALKSGRTYR